VNLAELQKRISQYVELDLSPLHEAYLAESPKGSIDGFLSYLAAARVIDAELLKQLHAEGSVEIPALDSPALAGTQLAAWSAGGQATVVTDADRARAAKGEAAQPEADATPEVRFEPLTRLGQGAMGAVDLARDVYLRRKVALKTVLPEMAAHPQLLSRFLTEMQITAQLEHPNVVPVYALEVGANGTLGYAMKLVHGKDLAQLIEEARERLDKGEPLGEEHSLERRLDIFLKVCDALEYAHEKGIVHRDLKPSNIMVGKHNEVYLMDWGIARPMGAGGQSVEAGIELYEADGKITSDFGRTRLGSAIGTPTYMSPEQAAGRNAELDGRSDLYTMGLILQECFTLHTAVGGTTLEEVLTKAKEGRRDPVPVKAATLPREIEAIVRRATALKPAERYRSVRELGDEVRRFQRDEAIEALPDGAVRKLSRWVSKHRMASLTIMLSLALAGSAATIGTLVVGRSRIAALHARELRESELEAESAITAQLLDRQLGRYEAALAQFAGAAQTVLSRPHQEGAIFFEDDFAKKVGPPDLAQSKHYGAHVSVLSPTISLAPGVSRDAVVPAAKGVSLGLSEAFRELMLDSAGVHSHKLSLREQRAVIADEGVPALSARVVLDGGVAFTFPGGVAAPKGDPREDLAYTLAKAQSGMFWGAPVARGSKLVLPLSVALFVDERPMGVAVLEVTMDSLLAQPGQRKLEYVQTKMLVARDGTVMAEQSDARGKAPLAQGVRDAIKQGKSGTLEYEEGGRKWIASYYSLSALDWYYVSIADLGQMLASKQPIVTSDVRQVVASAKPRAQVTAPKPTGAATALPSEPPDAGADDDAGDAGDEDAGVDAGVDAGLDAGPATRDAGAPLPPGTVPRPVATATPSAAPSAAPTAAPTAAPSAPPPPPNPFDKWQHYKDVNKEPKTP
jgi:serine/threonine protein kinase